jgi:thiol:disulfide interchange protein
MKLVLKNSLKLLILFTFIFSNSCSSKSKISKNRVINSIEFISNAEYSLTEVIELAQAQNKMVFVDFYADWCLPCKLLDEEVFNKRDVYSYFNRNFINYKVDIEKSNGANLKLMYGANELPTLLFLDEKGSVISRNNGQVSQTYIMSMAKNMIAD